MVSYLNYSDRIVDMFICVYFPLQRVYTDKHIKLINFKQFVNNWILKI